MPSVSDYSRGNFLELFLWCFWGHLDIVLYVNFWELQWGSSEELWDRVKRLASWSSLTVDFKDFSLSVNVQDLLVVVVWFCLQLDCFVFFLC